MALFQDGCRPRPPKSNSLVPRAGAGRRSVDTKMGFERLTLDIEKAGKPSYC